MDREYVGVCEKVCLWVCIFNPTYKYNLLGLYNVTCVYVFVPTIGYPVAMLFLVVVRVFYQSNRKVTHRPGHSAYFRSFSTQCDISSFLSWKQDKWENDFSLVMMVGKSHVSGAENHWSGKLIKVQRRLICSLKMTLWMSQHVGPATVFQSLGSDWWTIVELS